MALAGGAGTALAIPASGASGRTGRGSAADVLVLGPGGRVRTVEDRFLSGVALVPPALAGVPASTPTAFTGDLRGARPTTRGSSPPTGGVTLTPPTTSTTTTGPTTTAGTTTTTTGTTTTGTTTTGTTTTGTTTTTTGTTTTGTTTTGTTTTPGSSSGGGSSKGSKGRAQVTVVSVLAQLAARHEITAAQHGQYLSEFDAALADEKHLSGTRRAELVAITETMHTIAASGQMTVSRLPAMFLTLQRNVQWWTRGPLLTADQRVQFSGSQIVWEYYPDQGIQLQPLASFGEANGMYTAGKADYPAMLALLAQMLPLAADQDHGITWDYYFPFDGGQPPWSSAMTDGTALEAFTRAYLATGIHQYLVDGAEILPLLRDAPPRGLSIPTPLGRRFIQYSFTPGTDIINAFLQTVIGLYWFSHVSGNVLSMKLFEQGNAQAQAELPSFNTGAWSLYQPGVEDDLSYHQLVTGFVQELCTLTSAPVYCQTATAFQADLTTPPTVTPTSTRAPARHGFAFDFQLSKASRVGLVLLNGSQTAFSTSASFGYGSNSFAIPKLPAGTYAVHMSATDLAGNFTRVTGTLQVG